MVRVSRSWLNGKSKLPNQKELENLNSEGTPSDSIFLDGEALANPECVSGDIQLRKKLQTLLSALEETHPKRLSLPASPHLSRM